MMVFVALAYALLVSGVSLLIYGLVEPINPLLMGLIIFFLAILFIPFRQMFARMVGNLFYRGLERYEDSVSRFTADISQTVNQQEILRLMKEHIQNDLAPYPIHIYYLDQVNEQYVASNDNEDRISSDLRFSTSSPIVKTLKDRKGPVFLTDSVYETRTLQTDRTRFHLLGAGLVNPLMGRGELLGWVALGPRKNGEPYRSQDIRYLGDLCDIGGQAIEKIQVIARLEERVKQMNVLTRIAQGINITINQDDIFELIYAQTTQLLPTSDFSIIVLNKTFQRYHWIFYVENDDRIASKENIPLDLEKHLEHEVIKDMRPYLVQNYAKECARKTIQPIISGLSAWLSVPLLSGAEVIGALTIGRRDLDGVYTPQQVDLLEAIADQLAGAIEKTQLLSETQKRAQQMASLNEISRKLTSNLDFDSLLKNILQNAAQILNCEAGILLLVDEDSFEFILRATVGPIDEKLLEKRVPLDRGLSGRVYSTKRPERVNELLGSPGGELKQMGDSFGFELSSAMAVPLTAKDKIIGMIEIWNKLDHSPFTLEDEQLLIAFAAQASISVENARMYTLTDQQLEARVEELSVLQRVARELNATLDLKDAMQITLSWAMKQSLAAAGMAGIIEDGKVKAIVSDGYNNDLELDETGFLYASSDLLSDLEHEDRRSIRVSDQNRQGFLPNVAYRVLLPIRRESVNIGILLLEMDTGKEVNADVIEFLQRLTDHAAISIANAQLYAVVQKANTAKSEFVSFVSHELKNPMTSIKGYTELLAAGAVGPVNEGQQNFLMTIRSNVDRMSTLVSDLADESRIEAGRLRLDFEAISLTQVVDEVIRSEKRLIEEKNLVLDIQIEEDLPPAWADHTRLVQIVANLVSNARKYTLEGSSILITAKKIEQHGEDDSIRQLIQVAIQDTGLGISPEDQEKIFQKFFRSDDVRTREAPGTGLGLNITRSLVEAQGGVIWFESEFRKGTTFYFTIPVAVQ